MNYKDLIHIIRSSPDLYLILDPHLIIVEVSEQYLQATMVKRETIIGKNLFEIFPDNPNDPKASGVRNLRASLERVLLFKKPDHMAVQKYDIKRPLENGAESTIFEERYWSPVNTPVLNDKNEVIFIIHRVKDVTEFVNLKESERHQIQVSESLLHSNEIMGLDILFRARELQKVNEELRVAKDEAQQLAAQAEADNRSKSAFLATMSHEIRTSLNGVIGMTELLLDTSLSSQQLEFAETIRLSGEALLSVINNVLDYSKIESGNFQLDKVDFELQFILDQTLEIIIGQAYRKRIEIGAFVEPDVPELLEGDPTRIRQVLNNLICNAVKFTNQGEISIWVHLKEKKDDDLTLLFEITDTGVGMDEESLLRIFQPFSQAEARTAIKYGGTGLGLCISKQLIELMGGTIEVKSELGKGTTFSFTIKLKESKNNIATSYKILPEFKNVRALCVDDSHINRKILDRLLKSWGIRCDITSNPTKFVTMLVSATDNQDPYTLTLIDDCMSSMNGTDLTKIIRQLKEIASTPVIMMLSLGLPFNQNKLSELGIKDFITKPVHPKRLYNLLVNVILNKKAQDSPKTSIAPVTRYKKLNAHLLLAEDNYINQQICAGILNKFGLTVDIVNSGLEAIEAYKKRDYDLILMDCQMPSMDGYEATKLIREMEEKQDIHTPIIAMTAHALKGDKEKCILAGMDDYISKPIVVKKMSEVLNKWLTETIQKK